MWFYLLSDGVLSYSCPRAGRDALSARLSLLIGCYVSKDVLESSDAVEICECVRYYTLVGEEFGHGERFSAGGA